MDQRAQPYENGDCSSDAIKTRELLYRLIISQLLYDGHSTVAVSLAAIIAPDPPCPPSERLFHLLRIGLKNEPIKRKQESAANPMMELLVGPGLDLEFDSDVNSDVPEPALYETVYVTSHKASCRAGAFSFDGQIVATGSNDASIKILAVDRMLAKSIDSHESGIEGHSTHPVLRTLYDHVDEVTCLEFHPSNTILVSGSRDCTIKLFDYAKPSVKKAHASFTDVEPIECLSIHPLGDFIAVGTESTIIRLYDVNTGQCYVGGAPSNHHAGSVTTIKYSPTAKCFASGSRDGNIKIWDGVSNKCINTILRAHGGAEVGSVAFSRNGKYILSSGKDSLVRLWEVSSSRCLIAYTGAGTAGKQEHKAQAIFNHTEDFVMFPDEATTSLCSWNSRNASRQNLLSLGHNGPVRCMVHSPHTAAFLTCSDDFRARFWRKRH